MKIRQKIVNHTPNKNGWNNKRKYITIHETGNTAVGADADRHALLQFNGNSRAANWHWQVDDKEAVQSFQHSAELWAAGSFRGNSESIQIEICVNKDGNFKKAVANAVELTKKIMKEEGISASNVVQHNYWSGKNCPTYLRSGARGVDWKWFKVQLTSKPSKPSKTNPSGFKVGQKVTVKKTATTYATGQKIASFVKGNKYSIVQVKADRLLLSGIMSWVKKSDVN